MKSAGMKEEERYSLEMIASSYETRNEREEVLWRAFLDMFVKNHNLHALFTFEEVTSAYHAFLQALLDLARASLRLGH